MNGLLRQLGFIAVMIAVPIVSWYFVFQPQNELIESVQQDIRARQEKLDEVESMAADLQDLESIVEHGLRAIELIESKLPRQQDVESILEHLLQLQIGLLALLEARPVRLIDEACSLQLCLAKLELLSVRQTL